MRRSRRVQRIAVDVHHWMNAKQFADVYALSQLSPGPNVLIVTLIRYTVAGVVTRVCRDRYDNAYRPSVLAYYVSGFLSQGAPLRWPAIIQAALVPLSIGLMGASALILVQTTDRSVVAALITAMAAVLSFATAPQSTLDVCGRWDRGFYWPLS